MLTVTVTRLWLAILYAIAGLWFLHYGANFGTEGHARVDGLPRWFEHFSVLSSGVLWVSFWGAAIWQCLLIAGDAICRLFGLLGYDNMRGLR